MWDYTPKQAEAFAELAEQRIRRDRASQLSIAALAARGKGDEINKYTREWSE